MNKKLGILGGGQLGKMLVQELTKWDIEAWFMDADFNCPVAKVYPLFVKGDFKNYDDVVAFGKSMDIISVEIENVNTEALAYLESIGKEVRPQSRVLEIIKDKGIQKQFYQENSIPTSDFFMVESAEAIKEKLESGSLKIPFVQKARTAGYDGKGVCVVSSGSDVDKLIEASSIIEEKVDIHKELAVIVGRNASGQMTNFPIAEMVFNKKGHLLDYLIAPAEVSELVQDKCRAWAEMIITKLDMIGILAVEFFLTSDGRILVNEIAPRPHNSGHHTIDAGNYSQYNIHLRTLYDIPLPQIHQECLAMMINVLGEDGHTGPTKYEGLDEVMKEENVYPHLYGKGETRPLRKMGHVNIIGKNKDELLKKMELVNTNLKVKAWIN